MSIEYTMILYFDHNAFGKSLIEFNEQILKQLKPFSNFGYAVSSAASYAVNFTCFWC